MSTFFQVCAALGGLILILQVAAGAFGFGDSEGPEAELEQGLELLSVRALSAGLAFFGLGGFGAIRFGLGGVVAVPVGVALGYGAMVVTARVTRAILRLESDRTPRIEEAIGERATVYLSIPGHEAGPGKVHVNLRGRLAELEAVTRHDAIPTGSPVEVVDTIGETLIVVPLTPPE